MEDIVKAVGIIGGLILAGIGVKCYGDAQRKKGVEEVMAVMTDMYGADKLANDIIDYKNKLAAEAAKKG